MAFFTCNVFSNQLGMYTCLDVTIPDNGLPTSQKNVIYLLHGLSDNHSNWIRRTSVERYADEHDCILVIPEVQRSFYTDMTYGLNYFSYIAKELPKIAHNFFNITQKPEKSFIAGLSMGGYGALKCALTYPGRYAAVASFSAVCEAYADITPSFDREAVGILGQSRKMPASGDLFKLADKAVKAAKRPRIFMSCGSLDFLLSGNHKFRDHLSELGFNPHYEEWEDDHTWRFWDISVQHAMNFFFDEK